MTEQMTRLPEMKLDPYVEIIRAAAEESRKKHTVTFGDRGWQCTCGTRSLTSADQWAQYSESHKLNLGRRHLDRSVSQVVDAATDALSWVIKGVTDGLAAQVVRDYGMDPIALARPALEAEARDRG